MSDEMDDEVRTRIELFKLLSPEDQKLARRELEEQLAAKTFPEIVDEYLKNLEASRRATGLQPPFIDRGRGALDLGIIREDSLATRNNFPLFHEEFTGITEMGCEPIKWTPSDDAEWTPIPRPRWRRVLAWLRNDWGDR